jgi:tetratricopeptide (TPR) repeat protein
MQHERLFTAMIPQPLAHALALLAEPIPRWPTIEAAAAPLFARGLGGALCDPLERRAAAAPNQAVAWRLLAVARHQEQDHDGAIAAVARALALAPADRQAALTLAQLHLETGRPAAAAFAQLAGPMPGPLTLPLVGALAAEGRATEAETRLSAAVALQPDWREGLARLAALRQVAAQPDYDRGYREAIGTPADTLALRLDWFHLLAKARRWPDARAVLDGAAQDHGAAPGLTLARLFWLSESGEAADDPALFDQVADHPDPGLALARIRHALRGRRPDLAARIVEPRLHAPGAAAFWPYAALAWRLLDDGRAEWLDRPEALIGVHALDLSMGELSDLADLLRTLHGAGAPTIGQSVRGGTQTDRPLLFRHEPVMRRARAAITAAVEAYVAALPAPEPDHPLLGTPRGPIRFAGSWSVRLTAQGFHASHTHPAGWLSSACYIALPDALGPAPAGALMLGTPPPELNLDLAPYRIVEPVLGRLVLFPSTLWHATAPFADGERLTIAFDVAVPRGF